MPFNATTAPRSECTRSFEAPAASSGSACSGWSEKTLVTFSIVKRVVKLSLPLRCTPKTKLATSLVPGDDRPDDRARLLQRGEVGRDRNAIFRRLDVFAQLDAESLPPRVGGGPLAALLDDHDCALPDCGGAFASHPATIGPTRLSCGADRRFDPPWRALREGRHHFVDEQRQRGLLQLE